MTDSSYNGWTNHATWMVALHLDNDARMQSEALSIVTSAASSYDAQKELSEWVTDECLALLDKLPGLPSWKMLVTDLTRSYLDDVDWAEIAKNLTED